MEVHDLTLCGGGGRGGGGGGALATEDRDKIDGLMAAVENLTQVMSSQSNVAAQGQPSAWTRIMRINPSWTFPVRYECMMV
jgi:hypothetical protein